MNDLTPLALARRLGSVYGQRFGAEPLTYPQGVALSGRLRLAAIEGTSSATAAEITALVEPVVANPALLPDNGPCLATVCFADELFAVTGDQRHRELLLAGADRYLDRVGFDPDVRVEDFFFAGTLLGRAYRLTQSPIYADRLMNYLAATDTLQANGLYWHCHASPWFWGRGNAFAALGLAEALSYVPDHPKRPSLVARNAAHLVALAGYQHSSGLWHQVVDDPATYLEHSATTIIGCAIARGLREGWLDGADWPSILASAWDGTATRTGSAGELDQVCGSTGPLDNRHAYVERPFSTGIDERGGAMALWFSAEMARSMAGG